MRTGAVLSACFVDLDHFKRVNDEGGHRVGDQLLAAVAHRLLELQGEGRLIGRVGGEEFALLLPGHACAGSREVHRDGVRTHRALAVDGYSCTASVGVAEWDGSETLSDLLHRADLALLAAKRDGRNRIVQWSAGVAA